MLNLKKLKLHTVNDSGDKFCNVARNLSIVQNLWLVLDFLISIFFYLPMLFH